ncbi:GspS/AspS pilotin family protein [Edwardsiella tarda]|nr:type II secretion system pilot lipoprotein GspS-beta [Edwardsiella tarda]UCQ26589.1 GspS/AspS pilotin family protein [Edwardsiella tarda]
MIWKIFASIVLGVTGLLSGCASDNERVGLLVKKQAKNISLSLPVKSAGYTLVSAQSSDSSVRMTIISEAREQVALPPDVFLEKFQYQMCIDPTIKSMMNDGVSYSITINDMRTGNQHQRKLERIVCEMVKA